MLRPSFRPVGRLTFLPGIFNPRLQREHALLQLFLGSPPLVPQRRNPGSPAEPYFESCTPFNRSGGGVSWMSSLWRHGVFTTA
jgi:hypothetical protein